MLIIAVIILVLLWIFGFFTQIGGNLIHILLVVALVVFIVNMLSGRNSIE